MNASASQWQRHGQLISARVTCCALFALGAAGLAGSLAAQINAPPPDWGAPIPADAPPNDLRAFNAPRTPQVAVRATASAVTTAIALTNAGGQYQSVLLNGGQPQAVQASLRFDPSLAGTPCVVANVDGGTLDGATPAKTKTVAADGSASFTFQAPALAGVYHVGLNVNGVVNTLTFIVPSTTDGAELPTADVTLP